MPLPRTDKRMAQLLKIAQNRPLFASLRAVLPRACCISLLNIMTTVILGVGVADNMCTLISQKSR